MNFNKKIYLKILIQMNYICIFLRHGKHGTIELNKIFNLNTYAPA